MMKELISKKPTAVICSNYNMTLGALYCLFEAGIRIGDDISFVGFDLFSLTNMVYPPISVIEQNYSQVGIAAAKLLVRRRKGVLTKKFKTPFRKREEWSFDVKDFG